MYFYCFLFFFPIITIFFNFSILKGPKMHCREPGRMDMSLKISFTTGEGTWGTSAGEGFIVESMDAKSTICLHSITCVHKRI